MSQTFNGERESMVKIERSRSATNDSDVLEVYIRPESISERGGTISSVENSPMLPSVYEHRMRRLLQLNPPLATNRVHIPWYRRYVDAIPEKDQQFTFQPFREIQTRDEDIALQHQFGYHECMQEYVTRGMCRYPPAECKKFREAAMSRLSRIRRREQEKKEKKQRGGPQQEDT
ncbi:hypothetical protein RRG08_052292 [Elysia crispata]|uniref:Uncharacterized protein n=1 Tax=Elysia crispata TaxID=231223 RepID=A0AAE0ZZ04_9GAST|nr:hypothetical protein RRG08_052292 [Elysia crispata]